MTTGVPCLSEPMIPHAVGLDACWPSLPGEVASGHKL